MPERTHDVPHARDIFDKKVSAAHQIDAAKALSFGINRRTFVMELD